MNRKKKGVLLPILVGAVINSNVTGKGKNLRKGKVETGRFRNGEGTK